MIWKTPPLNENAIIYDTDREFRFEGLDQVNFFLNNPSYRYHGFRKINGIIWHFFDFVQ